MKVMVETSAHHVHVSKEVLETLFGKDAKLTNKKEWLHTIICIFVNLIRFWCGGSDFLQILT